MTDKSYYENYNTICDVCESLIIDLNRVKDSRIKISCTRARKKLTKIKKLCKIMRKQLLDEKHSIPKRKRKFINNDVNNMSIN
jgi:hypothetical protein